MTFEESQHSTNEPHSHVHSARILSNLNAFRDNRHRYGNICSIWNMILGMVFYTNALERARNQNVVNIVLMLNSQR